MENMNMGAGSPEEKKSTGAIISIVIIVLLLAFGAYYFLGGATMGEVGNTSATQEDQIAAALSAQGNSTELDAIQRDLDSTDYSGIDAGLSGTTF